MNARLLTAVLLVAVFPVLSSARTVQADEAGASRPRPSRADEAERSPVIIFFDDMESGEGGWTHDDLTQQTGTKFHVDTYQAFDGGHSWWCGEFDPSYSGGDGYGNNWDQILNLPPVDVSSAVYPVLEYTYSCDTEYDYDFVYVQVESSGAYVNLNRGYSGVTPWTSFAGYSVGPSTYDAPLRVRFRFVSDVAYSDEDGAYQSNGGAFHVDNIRVYDYYDGSTIFMEDCESAVQCTPSIPTAAGDWWHIATRPCSAYSGSKCWWCGDDADTSLVPGGIANALTSPAVNLSGALVCTLRFLLHAEVPTVDDDFWKEEISTDGGGTWYTTGVWWGDFGQCDGWATHGINGVDLSPYLPGGEFRFRVTMFTTANGCGPGISGGAGVMLDDTWVEDWTGSAFRQTSWGSIKAMFR